MLDPIDSSTRSHQDEGNSEIIDLVDSTSDYLPNQLIFFLQSTQIQTKIMKYIKFTSYKGNCGFNQSMCQIYFASPQDNYEVLSLNMHTIGSTSVQIITHH
jgi:hypothetical protein